jgi:hypothetical protein
MSGFRARREGVIVGKAARDCPPGPARQVEDAVKWMAGVGRWWWQPTRVGLLSCCAPTRGLIDVRSPLLAPKCVAFRSASRMFGRYPHLLVRSSPRRSQSKTVDVARTTVLKAGHTIYQFPFARTSCSRFPSWRGRKSKPDSASARRSCASGLQRKNAAEVPA